MFPYQFAVANAAVFILVLVITPILIRITHKYGWGIDQINNNSRKIHQVPTPRLGGIAVFIPFIFINLVFYLLYHDNEIFQADLKYFICVILCSTLMFFVGLMDDFSNVRGTKKLAMQIVISLCFWFFTGGITHIHLPIVDFIQLPTWLSCFFTLFWLSGITNTVNLIDGVDGLSSGIIVIASISLSILAYLTGIKWTCIVLCFLVSSTIPFVFFNWYPARVFIGDAGAYFLGFLIASISLHVCFNSENPSLFYVPVILLGLPITDTTYAIIRRVIEKRHLFSGDKKHLHHQILNLGLSCPQTVLILYGISTVLAIISVCCYFLTAENTVGISLVLLPSICTLLFWLSKLQKI